MKELAFPFDNRYILRNRKKIRKELLADNSTRIKKKIAVLGGSTTNDIVFCLELFLLNNGIEPEFYQSDYNMFWEDAVFGNEELDSFSPDIIFIHTTCRNISGFSDSLINDESVINERINDEFNKFKTMWTSLYSKFSCPIIQNNFELPLYRYLGNADFSNINGYSYYINKLNMLFGEYARNNNGFYINDINYLASCIGLEKWHNAQAWCMYKYALSTDIIPEFAYNLSNIIKSIYGKNKKVIALDLDNTLWGGVIGDDGQEGIEIGKESAVAQSFTEFQCFVKNFKNTGILLTVCSKNEEENALLGLNHPESVLKPDDFVSIKANWNSKDINIINTADDLSLLPESFVFIDDNPAECAIVSSQIPDAAVIGFEDITEAMYKLSRSGYFEVTSISEDDLKRNEMYFANAQRNKQKASFENYSDYLLSLEMNAEISTFRPVYLKRITQLINKSNQFNLTTRRYTIEEIEEISDSDEYIAIYGKLEDKFGDNGVVSVIIGKINGCELNIDLWLMSCRVLKRDMELAMLDSLVKYAADKKITSLNGIYIPTQKNKMVMNFYPDILGFEFVSESDDGTTQWRLDIENYINKNTVINIKESECVL